MKLIIPLIIFSLNSYADFDETKIQAPLKDSNDQNLTSTLCRTRDHLRWDVCYSKYADDSLMMKSFKFSNDGENKIVPKSGFGIGRSFEFNFEDFARSDLSLLVWDMPDETESHGHLKIMMFFPRIVMPAIRYISNDNEDSVIVTLPNLDEIKFNGKTKEMVSGVIEEFPVTQDADGSALEPKFNYKGSGVMLTAHRLNDYPVGVTTSDRKNQKAYISKVGHKICTVKASDLWYTDDNKGGNVLFNKKYVTDQAFDLYVKKNCGFSIY